MSERSKEPPKEPPREPAKPRIFRLETGAKRVAHDIEDEMEFHLAMRAEKLVGHGLAPSDARERALQQFGDLSAVRAECLTIDQERYRAMNRANRLQNLHQDFKYALRSLSQKKGFTIVTLLILALGIGGNTAMFSLIDVLVLRALPVPHAEQLVTIGDPSRTGSVSHGSPQTDLASYPLYTDLRSQTRTLSGLYASGRTGRLDVLVQDSAYKRTGVSGQADHPRGRFVSGNYFKVLQVQPMLGRTFANNEDQVPGDAPVAVISYTYWQRKFNGDKSVVGRVISINGSPFTIIGVTARDFTGDMVGQAIEMWMPIMMQPSVNRNTQWLTERGTSWLMLMGRLAPNATLKQAQTELAALMKQSLLSHASASQALGIENSLREEPVRVESGKQGFSYYRDIYARSLFTLMGAVALVLLVACANVANLLLARAAARGREMSVRMALGANRARLMQQLLTESALIAVVGGALGVLIAMWGSQALLQLTNAGRGGVTLDTHPDARILAFSFAVSLTTALLFGLAPSLRATRVELGSALRTSGRNVTGTGGRFSIARLLVVAQVAMSVLLLIGTGMFVRSTQRLETSDVGSARDKLVIVSVDARTAGYKGERVANLIRELTHKAAETPGVAGAAMSENGIFSGTESGTSYSVQGFIARQDADTNGAYDDVTAGYFHAIGAHVLQGRDFEESDNITGAGVAIINQTMAKYFFPKGDVLGHHITMGNRALEIVGVVADVKESGLRDLPIRRVYLSALQSNNPPSEFYLEIQAKDDPAKLLVPLRKALLTVDPNLSIRSIDPLSTLIRDSIAQDRLVAKVVTVFGVLTLVLSALGLYGVMAYATVRRTSEFGLRLALGAAPGSIVRLVLREALVTSVAGILIGLPFAYGVGQLLRDRFFGISLIDTPSITLAIAVLGGVALLASYVPALRASRVEPLDALRSE